ncbi:MAG: hypothetical protein WDZ51_16420 [Pirellulaceae bacterium]
MWEAQQVEHTDTPGRQKNAYQILRKLGLRPPDAQPGYPEWMDWMDKVEDKCRAAGLTWEGETEICMMGLSRDAFDRLASEDTDVVDGLKQKMPHQFKNAPKSKPAGGVVGKLRASNPHMFKR